MVIIQLAGGLGNQMFQYALYLQLKSLGKDVKIDDVSGFVEDRQRDPALRPFGVSYERATKKELRRMLDSSPFLHAKIRRKLCGRKKKSYFEEDKCYRPEIMTWDDIYLEGYWQTEKYFRAVSDQVRESYDTGRLLSYIEEKEEKKAGTVGVNSLRNLLDEVTRTESVSVHIRRGDYLLLQNQKLFGNICTEAYYAAAMEQMRREHPGCVFYLFTNDKDWAEKQINSRKINNVGYENAVGGQNAPGNGENGQIRIVDLEESAWSGMDRDYAEFILMSRCRHNIMANSSFSWWASYLNGNPHKTVLAPEKWLNGWNCEDLYRADMRKVRAVNNTRK